MSFLRNASSSLRATGRAALRPAVAIRIGVAVAAAVAIWLVISAWLGDRTSVTVQAGGRPVELLAPEWLHLVALAPIFFLVRIASLTDLTVAQQVVQATLRSLVIAALALALPRPSWITRDDRVATTVLVDVSDSVTDAQLAAARA